MILETAVVLAIPLALTTLTAAAGDMLHTHRLRTTATARREAHPSRPGTVGAAVVPCRVLPRLMSPFRETAAPVLDLDDYRVNRIDTRNGCGSVVAKMTTTERGAAA